VSSSNDLADPLRYRSTVTELASAIFHGAALLTCVGLPLYALRSRGRTYAIFAAVLLLLSVPGAWIVHTRIVPWSPAPLRGLVAAAFAWMMIAAGIHLAHLVRARMRGSLFRGLVSVPGQVFIAAGFMTFFWLLALLPVRIALVLFGWDDARQGLVALDLVPFVVAVASVATSLRPAREWVRVEVAGSGPADLERIRVERRRSAPPPLQSRPLRIVQITDPHLGPWQSVASLRGIVESLLSEDPDLVLLTGDFLTMEAQGTPGALAASLAPLRAWQGQCFAALGNHDYESPREVRAGLDANGVRLLVDEEVRCETPAGAVRILGADYVGRGRREHLVELLARHPRVDDALRLLLLHDPIGFQHIPDGAVDLTLSGHTHGGQVGLVSLGLDWTVLSRSAWPDHGLFGRGSNRLYVHRGTGFYGFPLRVGVPGELSVLEIVRGSGLPATPAAA
jgi:predicted MPP superfamily phosphohydrolase